jgi:hypothetical protein
VEAVGLPLFRIGTEVRLTAFGWVSFVGLKRAEYITVSVRSKPIEYLMSSVSNVSMPKLGHPRSLAL